MEMILVDWTCMGKTFCLAGVVRDAQGWKTIRPLPRSLRGGRPAGRGLWGALESVLAPATDGPRNVGWFDNLLGSIKRWDMVELSEPQPAEIERPHTEDLWVRALKGTGRSAAPAVRYEVLRATQAASPEPDFGAPLLHTKMSAYLRPGVGERSLVTVMLPSRDVAFDASWREGADAVDMRVQLKLPLLGCKLLPVKDHDLLSHGERLAAGDPAGQARALRGAIAQMGPMVAVRLGLSRGFDTGQGERRCWLMADGFFAAEDIQL